MKLKVISDYRERAISYAKGEEIQVDEVEAARLIADSPGSFKRVGGHDPEEPKTEASPKQKAKDKAPQQGDTPRHTELLAMDMNELKALGQGLGVNVRVFGLGKDKLISMILEAEAAGTKAPAGPEQDKMIGAAPEQK